MSGNALERVPEKLLDFSDKNTRQNNKIEHVGDSMKSEHALVLTPIQRWSSLMVFARKSVAIPTSAESLPGRDQEISTAERHFVNGNALKGPYPDGLEKAVFALGCFWGAERVFWQLPGVYVTAVGYAGGHTPNATYHEVCSGMTGHTEAVLVVFDPKVVSYAQLLKTFWEAHDPTQGMRQGNDVGTQYRSAIYTFSQSQLEQAEASKAGFAQALRRAAYGEITTEICPAGPFYFAEDDHQQYLAKNPRGYCGLGGTGVSCPAGIDQTARHA